MKTRHPTKLTDGIVMLHDNVHLHVAHAVQDQLNAMQWEVLRHPADGMDSSLAVFHILGSL